MIVVKYTRTSTFRTTETERRLKITAQAHKVDLRCLEGRDLVEFGLPVDLPMPSLLDVGRS